MKTFKAEAGETIYNAVERVKSEIYDGEGWALLIFNDVELDIHEESYTSDICMIYNLKRQLNK